MKIIETHCHLDYLKNESLEDILEKAKAVGVDKIITISVEPSNFDQVKELGLRYPEVYYTQGIHPHDAKKSTIEALMLIEERCQDEKMVAVGEIGLDFYYNHSPIEIQQDVFKQQLQIAIEKNKPVVIHSRDADQDMMEQLNRFAPLLKRKGVIHSFTSSKELALTALKQKFYIGFNGIITFKNAQNVRDIVEMTPLDQMLVETDAPFLTPVPHRGKENAPYYLPHVISQIAKIKNENETKVADVLYQNALNLFF
jgi:TatD DNase family protein